MSEKSKLNITIDNRAYKVHQDLTILQAAAKNGIYIPTLCAHKDLTPYGGCRMCVVEIDGCREPMTACDTPAEEGISVTTDSERLFRIRQDSLKLILVNHPLDCPICDKGGECLLQDLAYEFGIDRIDYCASKPNRSSEYATSLIRYWPDRCILCLGYREPSLYGKDPTIFARDWPQIHAPSRPFPHRRGTPVRRREQQARAPRLRGGQEMSLASQADSTHCIGHLQTRQRSFCDLQELTSRLGLSGTTRS